MVDRLVKIANFLDKHGFQEDADFITGILFAYKKAQLGSLDNINIESDYVSEMVEIPEDELELLRQVFSALGESLGEKGE